MPPRQALTRVAEDYLKAIWSAREWGGDPITAKELADRFRISAPTVSITLKRLAGQGLLTHTPYGPIELTEEGRRHAVAVVRRHRILETFLVEMLHYDWAEVHEEAEELEHAASDRLIARIAAVLGDPVIDPHGDPIPALDGAVQRPATVTVLDDAPPGAWQVTRVSDADPAVLTRLADHGLTPGRVLRVLSRDGDRVPVLVSNGRLVLSAHEATAVLLQPVTDSSL